jgi:CHASE3 domain sensor protein
VSAATPVAKVTPGLTARVVVAGGVLAVIVGTVFVILLVAINNQRDAAALSRHSQQVLVAASDLERFVVDLEAGERGFSLTHQESLLQPWTAALKAIPAQPAFDRVARSGPDARAESRTPSRHVRDAWNRLWTGGA